MEGPDSRRPAAARGPARDAERDQRIIRAALELLAEDGFEALTMERTAVRAGVAKATVYRRWAAKTDLAVDALRTLDDGPVSVPPGTEPTLRAELLGVLAAATGCSDVQRHAVSMALAEGARRHPVLAEAFQRQVVDMYLTTLRDIVTRAAARGEISAEKRDRLLDDDALEITTGPALALYRFLADGRAPGPEYVEKIVDRVVLPLMTRSP